MLVDLLFHFFFELKRFPNEEKEEAHAIGLRSGMISERILLDTYMYCTLHTISLENIKNAHG